MRRANSRFDSSDDCYKQGASIDQIMSTPPGDGGTEYRHQVNIDENERHFRALSLTVYFVPNCVDLADAGKEDPLRGV